MDDAKRRSIRFPIFAIAELRSNNLSWESSITTMVDNISLHGIGLYSLKPIEKGENVSLNIRFIDRDGSEKSGNLSGNVVWSIRYHDVYLIGIAFKEEITPANNPELYSYYQHLSPVKEGNERQI